MSEVFLAFVPDLFDVGVARFVACNEKLETQRVGVAEAASTVGYVVVHDAAQFVEECRRSATDLPQIIDIKGALKLLHGVARDQGGETRWNVWMALRPWCERPADLTLYAAIAEGRQEAPEAEECYRLLEVIAATIAKFWRHLQGLLSDAGEIERFRKVEAPAQQVFYHRQLKGIRVKGDRLDELINAANEEKYRCYLRIARALLKSPSGLTYRTVVPLLRGTDAEFLMEYATSANIEDYFRLAAETSSFAASFVGYMRASRDVNTLVQLTGATGRLFPTFSPMGTVTGRVLVSHPYLQELRRGYRGAIAADEGHELAYLDYAQFEPGILACMAKDNALIEAYNGADLYEALGVEVFKSAAHRPLAKRMFLAFCYGMSRANIVKMVAGPAATSEERDVIDRRIADFFEQFAALPRFRDGLQNELMTYGRVFTALGNRRVRTETGPLTHKEGRWVISQAIQGTASLIFKEALIDIVGELGADALLLPMHDAVLLQVPTDHHDKMIHRASNLMKAALKRRCEALSPKVIEGAFAA